MTRLTDEQKRLVDGHLYLVKSLCAKFRGRIPPGELDDFFQESALALAVAALNYRDGRRPFSVYAHACIRMSLLSQLRDHVARGFAGLGNGAGATTDVFLARCRSVTARLWSLSDPLSHGASATRSDEIPSRYDYSTWGVSEFPAAPVPPLVCPPGVQEARDGYVARGYTRDPGRPRGSVHLGLFSYSRFGGRDAAFEAACRAAAAFRAYYRSDSPDRSRDATLTHLRQSGFLPVALERRPA